VVPTDLLEEVVQHLVPADEQATNKRALIRSARLRAEGDLLHFADERHAALTATLLAWAKGTCEGQELCAVPKVRKKGTSSPGPSRVYLSHSHSST
jgi:hypothetical protein